MAGGIRGGIGGEGKEVGRWRNGEGTWGSVGISR